MIIKVQKQYIIILENINLISSYKITGLFGGKGGSKFNYPKEILNMLHITAESAHILNVTESELWRGDKWSDK